MNRMENNHYKTMAYWVYLGGFGLIFLLPFVNFPPLLSPAAWAQSILFKIIFTVLIIVFIAELLFKTRLWEDVKLKLKTIALPLAFFGLLSAAYLIATVFSLQPHFSFWGDPPRAGGTLNFLLLQAFAVFMFLVVKKDDWKKIFTMAFVGGILVCLMAIAQQLPSFGKGILLKYANRPPGSLGNVDFLATYLLLLFLPALVLGLQEQAKVKKIFYLGTSLLFFMVLILTISRAAFLGFIAGGFYFIAFYKFKNKRVALIRGISVICLVLLIGGVVYYANSRTVFAPLIENNHFAKSFMTRLSLKTAQNDARIVVWEHIVPSMIKDRPLLGYGPENFAIGFDKYYEATLPSINTKYTSWWDRAHNFIFEMLATVGILGLTAYLVFYGILFWKLEREKRKEPRSSQYLLYHALQATFIAYFVDSLFNFDTFATYLIFFVLTGYALYLIAPAAPITQAPKTFAQSKIGPVIALIVISLLGGWFIVKHNIQPLNTNMALNYQNYFNRCKYTLALEKSLKNDTFLNTYMRVGYANALKNCLDNATKEEIAKKAIGVLGEAVTKEPYYVRSWIYLAAYTNILLELHPQDTVLQAASEDYLKKAAELSPGRSEIFHEWARKYIIIGDYQQAIQKADHCASLYPDNYNCYFSKAIAYLYLNNEPEVEKQLLIAKEKGYDIDSKEPLESMVKVYIKLTQQQPGNLDYYRELAMFYQKLITLEPNNFQYHASLAYTYKTLGQYQKAREEALKVIELSPASKPNVEEFLKTLP
ncbi:MAG: tetratricopeptide repeat protein [Candidatus Staskawiczbacteria bacterium]|nr:tetratricopeptide repeat protein [Candidatus Staskawiczbacteria bacterium]